MVISTTKISKNGQVVIPSDIRKETGVKPGTTFLIYVENNKIVLIKEELIKKEFTNKKWKAKQ